VASAAKACQNGMVICYGGIPLLRSVVGFVLPVSLAHRSLPFPFGPAENYHSGHLLVSKGVNNHEISVSQKVYRRGNASLTMRCMVSYRIELSQVLNWADSRIRAIKTDPRRRDDVLCFPHRRPCAANRIECNLSMSRRPLHGL
jgi:hypothetical protein